MFLRFPGEDVEIYVFRPDMRHTHRREMNIIILYIMQKLFVDERERERIYIGSYYAL